MHFDAGDPLFRQEYLYLLVELRAIRDRKAAVVNRSGLKELLPGLRKWRRQDDPPPLEAWREEPAEPGRQRVGELPEIHTSMLTHDRHRQELNPKYVVTGFRP